MFEKSSRMKLRFATDKGILSVEDLWDLNLEQLNIIAKTLNQKIKESKEEDFLNEVSVEDAKAKLAFEIVIHILNTKKKESEDAKDLKKKKLEKEKLLEILAKKQDQSLENLSVEELKAKIENL
jgi:hypothetical protein